LVAGGLLTAMAPALATSSEESDFFSKTNHERSSRGIRTLTLDAHLSDVARRHSQDMADQNDLSHNDNLGNEVSGWEELDENVGEGGSVYDIHRAFMNSDVHRDAILGNYEKVGIGTVWRGDTLWVTEVFYRAYHSTTASRTTTVSRPQTAPPAPPRAPLRRAVRAPAPRPAPRPAPVPPVAPLGVVMPDLSSGRIEKLLGDLMVVPSEPGEPDEGGTGDIVPLRPAGADRVGSAIWRFIDAQAS
jgi:hypothetical protein